MKNKPARQKHFFRRAMWRSVSFCLDTYAYLINGRSLLSHGIINRPPVVTRKEILQRNNLENPELYFKYFSQRKKVSYQSGPIQNAAGVITTHFTFRSPFVSPSLQVDSVPAVLYRTSIPLGVVIWVGTLFGSFNSWDHRMARMFAEEGFDCCVLALPFHGPRAIYGRSGYGWLAPNPVSINESFTQTVCDITRLYEILKGKFNYSKIYAAGVSVGGNAIYVSSFLKKFEKVALIATGVSLAEIFWHSPSPYTRKIRSIIEQKYSLEEIKRLWLMSDGTEFKISPLAKEFLLINGLFDTLAKPRYALRLARSLPNYQSVIYPASHHGFIFFMHPAIKNAIRFFCGKSLRGTVWTLNS